MKTRHGALLLLSVLPIASLPGAARAFYVEARAVGAADPIVVRYDTSEPLVFRVATMGNPGGAEVVDAIRAAFATWNAVPCSTLSFMEGDPVTTEPDAYHWMTDPDRYILVYFSDNPAIWGTTMGVGFFQFGHDGAGTMIGASIVLNTRDHLWSTNGLSGTLDVQATVTALIGRSLGITSLDPASSTFPRYRTGDRCKRELGMDDLDALRYLYGDACTEPAVDPEAICEGTPMEMCPPDAPMPPPPGDAECAQPVPGDAGPGPGSDAGPSGDAGMPVADGGGMPMGDGGMVPPPGDDGCGCVVAGADPRGLPAAGILLGMLALGVVLRRRR